MEVVGGHMAQVVKGHMKQVARLDYMAGTV